MELRKPFKLISAAPSGNSPEGVSQRLYDLEHAGHNYRAHLIRRTPTELAAEYPRLYEFSWNRGLEILAAYTKSDLMLLFDCSEKTIRRRTVPGGLPNRGLPNRGRCLPSDLEQFLAGTEYTAVKEITGE